MLVRTRRGDTIIEVTIAILVSCVITVISISLMNSGIKTTENSLELIMARNSMNAQAEALRFLHSAYLTELRSGNTSGKFGNIWKAAISKTNGRHIRINTTCDEAYGENGYGIDGGFVINTRKINEVSGSILLSDTNDNQRKFRPSSLYSRIVFGNDSHMNSLTSTNSNMVRAEGIWVTTAKDPNSKFYDFYIQSCWFGVGSDVPSTLVTVIRLYNPEIGG